MRERTFCRFNEFKRALSQPQQSQREQSIANTSDQLVTVNVQAEMLSVEVSEKMAPPLPFGAVLFRAKQTMIGNSVQRDSAMEGHHKSAVETRRYSIRFSSQIEQVEQSSATNKWSLLVVERGSSDCQAAERDKRRCSISSCTVNTANTRKVSV